MKKLKVKVFSIIFILLTIFTLIVVGGTTAKTYIEKKNTISDILTKVPKTFDRRDRLVDFLPSRNNENNDSRRIYLDFTIYTVVLDKNGEYLGVINHTSDDNVSEENIKTIANNIIQNHKEKVYIGNLYTDKYAYAFSSNNTLVIMDNTKINQELLHELFSNVILFFLCEIVIFLVTYLVTKWITTPVDKSFEKQKIFVADASHELKTPLSVMVASADAYFNDKDEKWVKNMKNESERMIKLVTELLDLAKTEQQEDIVMEQNDLSNIIESSILTFESLFYDNKIKLDYNIEPEIKMVCNEDLITELMGILIDNAIKHCSGRKKVLVNLSKNNKQIILEVINTGLPIKKEDEEKIFERFYKVDTSRNRNSNNYGLGLAIAKNIVIKHNGVIKAYSLGGYTTFKITWNQK